MKNESAVTRCECLTPNSELSTLNWKDGAGGGIRTRDPNLGKVVLYQLSYTRILIPACKTRQI